MFVFTLQRLLKLCDQSHSHSLDKALQTMTSIAGHINHMKGVHEHAVRVQEIGGQLYGWTGADLTAMGELIAEGGFRVGGPRSSHRQVFLFDKVLLITKSKSDGALAYKSHIMVRTVFFCVYLNFTILLLGYKVKEALVSQVIFTSG